MKLSKAFTLIELLVVISIISLLASVVLSSLNSAREKAEESKAVSTSRQALIQMEISQLEVGDYSDVCTYNENGALNFTRPLWEEYYEKGYEDGGFPLGTKGNLIHPDYDMAIYFCDYNDGGDRDEFVLYIPIDDGTTLRMGSSNHSYSGISVLDGPFYDYEQDF